METKTYKGLICQHPYGEEEEDILFLSSLSEPLAEVLEDDISCKTVTARYWISDKEITKEEAQEDFIRMVSGLGDCEFGSCYSDLTGYLWTDEEITIGGHDLLQELRSGLGKWLILEIDIY